MSSDFDLDELVGGEFDFYGVDGHRFRLDGTTYEVIEDSSGTQSVVISDVSMDGLPIARVIVENLAFDDWCYEINDLSDDHCWLEFGMRCYISEHESYFEYFPKGPAD